MPHYLPDELDRPLEWWEEVQVSMLRSVTETHVPDCLAYAVERTSSPRAWREFRAEFRRYTDPVSRIIEVPAIRHDEE